MIDARQGVGVAVEVPPSCDCAACLTSWWEDRTEWEAELLIYDVAVVSLVADMPGRLPAMTLGSCVAWGGNGAEVALWSPDALPVHSDDAEAMEGHPALPSLWEALGELVEVLDLEVA